MNRCINTSTPRPGTAHFAGWVWRMKLDPLLNALCPHASNPRRTRLSTWSLAQYTRLKQLKPTERLGTLEYLDFFTTVAREMGDPCLGARVGTNGPSPVLSPLRELFLNADTLHDALLDLNRSSPALQDGTQTELRIEGDVVCVSYQLSSAIPDHLARQDVEYSLGLLIQAIRARLGVDWRADALNLRHPLHICDRRELGTIFGCTQVVDGGVRNGIVFPAALLTHRRASPGHDENVLSFFRQYVHDLCTEHTCHSFRDRVKTLLESHLDARALSGQAPTLEWAASLLHQSARSLQRKLALENASFSSLLDEVRHDLALKWMRQQHVHIGDLAEHLGYANHAAFCSAFKRWSGVAPSRYRRALLPQKHYTHVQS